MRSFPPSGVLLLVAVAFLLSAASTQNSGSQNSGAQSQRVNTATRSIPLFQLARATAYGPAHPPQALTVRLALNVHNKSTLLNNHPALLNYVRSINNPANALHGQRLTPDQSATAYAPSAARVQHVVLTQQFVSDLQSARFTNITVEPNHPLVSADGTVAQANAAFNPTIEQFRQFGARVIGNTSAAQVPVTLGSLVASVLGRNNTIGKMQPALVTRTQAAIPTCDFSYNPPGFRKLYGATTVPKASDASNASNAIIAASDLGFAPLRLYRLYKPSPAGITKRASARSRSSSCIAT